VIPAAVSTPQGVGVLAFVSILGVVMDVVVVVVMLDACQRNELQ
jgi:hypothetical protein